MYVYVIQNATDWLSVMNADQLLLGHMCWKNNLGSSEANLWMSSKKKDDDEWSFKKNLQ